MATSQPGNSVLVVNPPLLFGDDFIDYPWFTGLGAVNLAAVLRARGFRVSIADAHAARGAGISAAPGGGFLVGATLDEILQSAPPAQTVILCLPPFLFPNLETPHMHSLLDAIHTFAPHAPIVAADAFFSGMHYIAYDGAEFLERYARVQTVVQYECEAVIADVAADTDAYRGRVVRGVAADVVPDTLPHPAWDLLPVRLYYQFQRLCASRFSGEIQDLLNGRILPVVTSRGCPFSCSFCTANPGGDGPGWRAHSPEYLADMFLALRKEYHAEKVAVLDGIPNADPDRFEAILESMYLLALGAEFPNGLRADRLTRKHLEMLRRITPGIKVSAECGDRDRLRDMGKRLDPAAVEQVAAWCDELGLPLKIHYMIGLPGETPEQANATLAHATAMREKFNARPLVQYCVPIPGTRVHGTCRDAGLLRGFEPAKLYSYFTNRPVLDQPQLPAAALARRRKWYDARAADSQVNKLIINLTYACSNNCVFCAIGDRDKTHCPPRRVRDLLTEYRERGVTLVDFDGGEPTMHPRFLPIVMAAHSLGYEQINVTTNARRLADRAFASRFLLSGLTSVLVSLHGHTCELHEQHTRAPGSFAETLQGIRHTVELKPGRVEFGINTTLTADNAPHLCEFLEFAKELGAPRVNIQFLTPHGNAQYLESYDPEPLIPHVKRALDAWDRHLDIAVINALPCHMEQIRGPGDPDTSKYSRDMAFIDTPLMNLGRYLDQRRVWRAQCGACEAAVACQGFYVFNPGDPD